MIAHEQQRPPDDDRARALQRLVPALVHRLNGALLVVNGVLELGARAGAKERSLAQAEAEFLGRALERLAALARRPEAQPRVFDLCAAVRAAEVLVRPLAESRGVRLETRLLAALLPVRAPADLEGTLIVLVAELLAELGERVPLHPLRLTVRLARGRGVVTLAACGLTFAPAAQRALHEHAGPTCVVRSRRAGRAVGLSLSFPVPEDAHVEVVPPARRPRVLLVHSTGEARELTAMLLREHGCQVTEDVGAPKQGSFQLALVEVALARRDPALLDALRARTSGRIELLELPLRPTALLELIRV